MSNISRSRHLPFILAIVVALGVGVWLAPDYGESWDERNIQAYVHYALEGYRFVRTPMELTEYTGPGPAGSPIRSSFYVAEGLLARYLASFHPEWSLITSWHFLYFLVFLAGAAALYLLALRWISPAAALATMLLYLTQPLFWGHAFINPKDIQFMALFAVSVYAGFSMIDHLRAPRWINLGLVPAAFLLGVTSSVRVAGPLAGLIVVGYAISRLRTKAILPVLVYGGLAAITMYVSWPLFWGATIRGVLDYVLSKGSYPFDHSVLFAGSIYRASQLPSRFFPTMVGIQLTEPAVLLVAIGLVLSVVASMRREAQGPLLLFLSWCLAPALAITAAGSTIYDNARQLYFLLPPLFIAAGLVFDRIFKFVKMPSAKAVLVLIAILPGTVATIQLHPYEYVYYNSLVGGTGGAYGQYEMDYWATSFKEMTDFINSTSEPGASVGVYGPTQLVLHAARPDLRIFTGPSILDDLPSSRSSGAQSPYDLRLVLIRAKFTTAYCANAPELHTVGRMGAVFSVLRGAPQGGECK